METKFQSLFASALIATTIRLFMYMFGGHKSYLRAAIEDMGITVVILEICIVLLRFFSALTVMRFLIPKISLHEDVGSFLFISIGILSTYVLTTLPLLFPVGVQSSNVAISYLSQRPFELIPVFVEYFALYVINKNLISSSSFNYIICVSVIALIIAIHDSDYKNNRN